MALGYGSTLFDQMEIILKDSTSWMMMNKASAEK